MTANSNPIFVIGSINTDMVAMTEVLPSPGETVMSREFMMTAGGKGANQAVAAARMGGDVTMIGRLGNDVFAEQSIKRLKSENINCEFITKDTEKSSGVALISVDQNGENHIVVAPGANETLTKERLRSVLSQIPDNAIVMMQLEIPLESVVSVIEFCKKSDKKIILDPAPAKNLTPEFTKSLYMITPNETEATAMTGVKIKDLRDVKKAAIKLLGSGFQYVLITMGANGVYLASQNDEFEYIPSPKVTTIDSTAAGDCFNGTLAVSLSQGLSVFEAAKKACRAASISVTRKGAQDSMPFINEL
tara:strand:+ start:4809 stop:5720 length:912 start_codon:yes stop_codon:yes gene_type:complete